MRKFMRIIILLTTLLISFSCLNHSKNSKKTADYRIEIRTYGMTWDDKYLFTHDSIIITPKRIIKKDSAAVFLKKLSESDQQTIINALLQINFDDIDPMYVNNSAPDDMPEFDFEITVNSKIKKFHIYQVKVNDIFNLVKQLNKLVPDNYKIGYTEAYFRYLK